MARRPKKTQKQALIEMVGSIESEGFDYYFTDYTSYQNCGVEDKELEQYWDNYNSAREVLQQRLTELYEEHGVEAEDE